MRLVVVFAVILKAAARVAVKIFCSIRAISISTALVFFVFNRHNSYITMRCDRQSHIFSQHIHIMPLSAHSSSFRFFEFHTKRDPQLQRVLFNEQLGPLVPRVPMPQVANLQRRVTGEMRRCHSDHDIRPLVRHTYHEGILSWRISDAGPRC